MQTNTVLEFRNNRKMEKGNLQEMSIKKEIKMPKLKCPDCKEWLEIVNETYDNVLRKVCELDEHYYICKKCKQEYQREDVEE
jgi:uncharacterized protein with PIN domain